MAIARFTVETTALLVVDFQPKLIAVMRHGDRAIENAGKLIDGCRALGVPILATEQYPEGLGPTVELIAGRLPDDVKPIEKLKFSACVPAVRDRLAELGRPCVLICGIEAHVCVLQTALDLAEAGYVTGVVSDAVSSRRKRDERMAIQRMVQAGVVPVTSEMALLEMVHEAGTEMFRSILPLIR